MSRLSITRSSKLQLIFLEKQSKRNAATANPLFFSTTKGSINKQSPVQSSMMKAEVNQQYGSIHDKGTTLLDKIKLGLIHSKKPSSIRKNVATNTITAASEKDHNIINDDNGDQDNDHIQSIWKNLTMDDLAPIDAFHTRGKKSTTELASLIIPHSGGPISPEHHVLDVGCGLGGTARYLANEYGCDVVGIDLTTEYIEVGNKLSQTLQLNDKVILMEANALELPFSSNNKNNNYTTSTPMLFDMVWTEHVQMNIENKVQFCSEISRVLQPGGYFLFHDVFLDSNTAHVNDGKKGVEDVLHYPVPWAEDGNLSHLVTEEETKEALVLAGLEVLEWTDKSEESIAFFEKVLQRARLSPPPQQHPYLGIHLLMGDNTITKLQNHLQNLQEKRTKVGMGIAIKSMKAKL